MARLSAISPHNFVNGVMFCNCTDLPQSTEVENAFLLALSELLISTLLPLHTGAHLLTGPEASAAVVTAHAEDLLRSYVLDARWARTPALLAQSLRVLALLLSAPLDVHQRDTHLTKLFAALDLSQPAAGVSSASTESGATNSAYLHGDALLRQADRLLDTVLSASLAPAVPASTREDAVAIAERALHLLRAHCGRTKLKGFAYYEKAELSEQSTVEAQARVLACKLSVQRGVANLLAGLNDSHDQVRDACVQAVGVAVPLLLSEGEVQRLSAEERLLLAVCGLTQMQPSSVLPQSSSAARTVVLSADGVVRALLTQVRTPGAVDSAEFLAYLNDTLRLVCVLDPRAFEVTVRGELAPLLEKDAAAAGGLAGDALNEFVSGLLNHVDVLLQFN
jgi:hypothetical protein